VRFLLDDAIQHRLADHLAEAGHDATHVLRIGLAGSPDEQVLERAVAVVKWDRVRLRSLPIEPT
jgi:predicted nuclease of predicted toxin-antitoxin system